MFILLRDHRDFLRLSLSLLFGQHISAPPWTAWSTSWCTPTTASPPSRAFGPTFGGRSTLRSYSWWVEMHCKSLVGVRWLLADVAFSNSYSGCSWTAPSSATVNVILPRLSTRYFRLRINATFPMSSLGHLLTLVRVTCVLRRSSSLQPCPIRCARSCGRAASPWDGCTSK